MPTAILTATATIMLDRTGARPVSGDVPNAALQRLFAWLSPAFPVGAYTYSHGLEWAIGDGTVASADDLALWLDGVLRHGGGRNDAILFAHAWRAADSGDGDRLRDIARLAAAFQPSRERCLETTAQGRAFMLAVVGAWPNNRLDALADFVADEPLAYPVAVAAAAAAHAVPLEPAAVVYLGAFVSNVVSAGVRAIPIGQSDGQRIIAALAPACETVAAAAVTAELDELGGAALLADIASMKHETQYTRLFRS